MKLKEITEKINSENGNVYLVGGAVRDSLLNLPIKDNDFCVTGLTANKFKEIFPEAEQVGKNFPVFLLKVGNKKEEFALARTEKKNGVGYTSFDIFSSPELNIEDDLLRRDLTINSMAINLKNDELVDPFNGKKDLENGILKHVSNAFSEDPLRVLRVARFAARYNFKVNSETLKLMNDIKSELSLLTTERVFEEFKKALSENTPSKFFEVLNKANVLDIHFPEIKALIGQIHEFKHHPEGDAFQHTMKALDAVSKITNDLETRFAVLVHDLGKGLTPKEELPKHHGHEKRGLKPTKQLCDRFNISKWKKSALCIVEHHMKMHKLQEMRSVKIVDLVNQVNRFANSNMMLHMAMADELARGKNFNDVDFWNDVVRVMKSTKADPNVPVDRIAEDKRLKQASQITEFCKK